MDLAIWTDSKTGRFFVPRAAQVGAITLGRAIGFKLQNKAIVTRISIFAGASTIWDVKGILERKIARFGFPDQRDPSAIVQLDIPGVIVATSTNIRAVEDRPGEWVELGYKDIIRRLVRLEGIDGGKIGWSGFARHIDVTLRIQRDGITLLTFTASEIGAGSELRVNHERQIWVITIGEPETYLLIFIDRILHSDRYLIPIHFLPGDGCTFREYNSWFAIGRWGEGDYKIS